MSVAPESPNNVGFRSLRAKTLCVCLLRYWWKGGGGVGGGLDFQERSMENLTWHFFTEKESASPISADSEQLGKSLRNSHIGPACTEPLSCSTYPVYMLRPCSVGGFRRFPGMPVTFSNSEWKLIVGTIVGSFVGSISLLPQHIFGRKHDLEAVCSDDVAKGAIGSDVCSTFDGFCAVCWTWTRIGKAINQCMKDLKKLMSECTNA